MKSRTVAAANGGQNARSLLDGQAAEQAQREHDPDLGRPTQAVRIAWQLSHHPVPDGLQVLHLCDHPWCVRPTHLVLGSQAANMADRARKQWVRACSRPRYTDRPHDAYQTAAQVRARHRRLAAAAGQQLALF